MTARTIYLNIANSRLLYIIGVFTGATYGKVNAWEQINKYYEINGHMGHAWPLIQYNMIKWSVIGIMAPIIWPVLIPYFMISYSISHTNNIF